MVHKESGEVRSHVVADVTGHTLRKAIADHVAFADLHIDTHRSYVPIGREFRSHESVNHFRAEYVRGEVSTNQAEGYFSQLKRSIDGTHHHVSCEHLDRYLAQHDFPRSTHNLDDSTRLCLLAEQTGGRRLTYKPLTGAA